MKKNLYDHLLRLIALARRLDPQDLDVDRAYTRLDEYVEREFAGEPVAASMPDVAYFIVADTGFAEVYRALRRHFQTFDPDGGEADSSFDMAALEAWVNGAIMIEPEDIARPVVSQPMPANDEREYLHALLPYWQQYLPQHGGIFMSGGKSTEVSVELPEQEVETQLDLIVSYDVDGAAIDGRIQPPRSDLIDCPVRLYRFNLEPEPMVEIAAENPIDLFGRFVFEELPAGRYVLAMVIAGTIIGATWLDI